jgi:general secretion pathway protein G
MLVLRRGQIDPANDPDLKGEKMQNTIARLRKRQSILKDREGGFTLIELLIVIVILGILAAIVVFAVQNLTGSSAQSSCGTDFKTVETAQEAYKAQEGQYATSIGQLTGTTAAAPTAGLGPWLKDAPGNTSHYIISIDTTSGTTYGDIMVAATTTGHTTATDGSGNCAYVS